MKILEIKDKLPILKTTKKALLYMVKNSKYEKNTHKQR